MFLQQVFASRFCTAVILLFVLNIPLSAQSTGTISGFVIDPTGLPVPGAAVTAVLLQQQVRRTVQSGQDGSFLMTALLPGDYYLTVEKQGFQRVTQTDLVLAVNQNLRVDAQ